MRLLLTPPLKARMGDGSEDALRTITGMIKLPGCLQIEESLLFCREIMLTSASAKPQETLLVTWLSGRETGSGANIISLV